MQTETKTKARAAVIYSLITLMLIGIDQLTKYLVLQYMADGVPVTVIPHVLQFRYIYNTGAAFSMFSGRTLTLSAVTIAILIVLIVLFIKGRFSTRLLRAGAILVIAGGFGNLIDRLFRHYVVDFIEFTFTQFAVFNFADCCVTIGAVLLIIAILISIAKDSGKEKQDH